MPRIQGLELEDQPWFPGPLREWMTDFLSFMSSLGGEKAFGPFVEQLAPAFRASGAERLVEMAAGAGAPGRIVRSALARRLGRPVGLLLTDLYPNLPRFRAAVGDGVEFSAEPVDATKVPADLRGFRFMCNSFHHLPPELARKVIADAVAHGQGIAVLELAERSVGGMIQIFFGFLMMALATPLVRPFSVGRLVFTYLLPVVPLATVWDGVVSCLRIYSPEELRALVAEVPGAERYTWNIDALRVEFAPSRLTILIGVPSRP